MGGAADAEIDPLHESGAGDMLGGLGDPSSPGCPRVLKAWVNAIGRIRTSDLGNTKHKVAFVLSMAIVAGACRRRSSNRACTVGYSIIALNSRLGFYYLSGKLFARSPSDKRDRAMSVTIIQASRTYQPLPQVLPHEARRLWSIIHLFAFNGETSTPTGYPERQGRALAAMQPETQILQAESNGGARVGDRA